MLLQVIYNHPQVPAEWKKDQTHERSFAQFYQTHVQKGSYKMNSEGRVRHSDRESDGIMRGSAS